jgi:hypothetical protein
MNLAHIFLFLFALFSADAASADGIDRGGYFLVYTSALDEHPTAVVFHKYAFVPDHKLCFASVVFKPKASIVCSAGENATIVSFNAEKIVDCSEPISIHSCTSSSSVSFISTVVLVMAAVLSSYVFGVLW